MDKKEIESRNLSVFETSRALNEWYTSEKLNDAIIKIETNTGSPLNCLGFLSGHALACSMMAWFDHNSLAEMRNWSYVKGKLEQKAYIMSMGSADETYAPGAKMLALLSPLLSNSGDLINWYANNERVFNPKRVEDHKTHDFWAYQAIIALRGEWPRLAERCDRVIADPPGKSTEQKYLIDHQFFLALARGDIAAMAVTLREIADLKRRRARSNDESASTQDLISTPAVIYAKIAWFHGYEVEVGSPYIPSEWLPTAALRSYRPGYSFLES